MTEDDDSRIAVIGMAVRLPGAEDTVDLRRMLTHESVEVDEVPASRWARELYLGEGGHQGSHHRGAFLQDPFSFDHEAFGMTAEDAVLLDPQQRLMLEVGGRAFEDAGCLASGRRLNAGVFVGARMNSYGFDQGRGLSPDWADGTTTTAGPTGSIDASSSIASTGRGTGAVRPVPAALWGRSQNFMAAWLSDRFDLSGPSLVVDTACSSSLTAVWLACRSLRAGDCELAVVGAVDLLIDPLTFVLLSRTGALSKDGLCHTFDEKANGYVPGEGAAALVLKPMKAAVADGDLILGAIAGVGVNNDGHTMGVTTPSLEAQVELLTKVYGKIDPSTVQYIEAHGTGTAIGDPIEVRALTEVFGRLGAARGSVALGSLKRRIGHLHSASGLAGLAKIITSLHDGLLPGIAVEAPNPRLGLETSPFYLPETSSPWPSKAIRRAGVSGFGFGGTNVHVVAEAVPAPAPVPAATASDGSGGISPRPVEVLPLSADSPDGLRELATQWLEFLPTVTADDLGSVCATARLARPHRAVRTVVTGHDTDALAAALRARLLSADVPRAERRTDGPRPTVMVRPTEGSAPPGWLTALNRSVPSVRETVGRFEEASGRRLTEFSGELLRICAGVALVLALRDLGLPEQSMDLPSGWQPIADFAHGRASLEQALAEVLSHENDERSRTGGRPGTAGTGLHEDGEICARLAGAGATDEREVAAVFAAVVAEIHESGQDIDWAAFQGERAWDKRLLPVAQPRGRALDLREPLRSPEPGAPVTLDSDAGADGGYAFSRVFGPGEVPIAQHSVYRRIMLPGVAWFDFLRQGAELRGDTFHGVRDVLFHRPLIPSATAGAQRVVCRVDGGGRFTVEDGVSEVPYVTGRFAADAGPAPEPEPVDVLLRQCSRLHAGSSLYRWLRRIGYHHGRYYRNISWVASLPDGGTLARIEGGRQREMNPADVRLFPGLLDSVTIAAIDPDNPVFGADDATAFIPLSADRVLVHGSGSLDDAAYVRTEVFFWNEEACRVTQVVTDAAGKVLLVFGDISSKRVPGTAFGGETDVGGTAPPDGPTAVVASAAEPATGPSETVAEPARAGAVVAHGSPAARVLAWFLELTGVSDEHTDTEFLSAGFDSVGLVGLSDRISQEHGLSLYPTVFFEYPTPREFADYLVREAPDFVPPPAASAAVRAPEQEPAPEQMETQPPKSVPAQATSQPRSSPARQASSSRDIAVVGAAIRVPTARTLADYWSLLAEGRDTVRKLPPDRWSSMDGNGNGNGNGNGSAVGSEHTEVPHASFLESVDEFDPAPFRISAREAPLIDPQARIVYETIWEALEDAGRLGDRARDSRTGLWIAYSHDHYHEERSRHGVSAGRGLGLEAMIPNRLSYLMDWHGPSAVVNTLCSSSLVALHTALQHLRAGDIDTAVIGGVHAAISPEYFRSMGDLMALSPQHRCRSFDASADGFTPGEGAVAVVLRRYEDAHRDSDRVRGLIKGAAVNHGGRTTRYSAPSPRAQREVISTALKDAGIGPESIGMVEAHGTGTSLGDPIEVDGLSRAWREWTDRTQFCAIGSLKSNIGHLEPAAGLAGLVKVLLAMEYEEIPPTLHVTRPNDHIRFEDSPFYVADRPVAWPRTEGAPRRAALSAFGMGGVNTHVIIEEPPAVPAPESLAQESHVLRVSGATEDTVRELAAAYAHELGALREDALSDFVFTANAARASHRYRTAVRGATHDELAHGLNEVALGGRTVTRLANLPAPAVFMFTGQGSQYGDMGRGLFATEPLFRAALEECAELLAPHTDTPLLELLFGEAQAALDQTRYAQIGIVSVQVALVRMLEAWGIRPDMVVGHSVGELTAAWAAGAVSLPDLLRLVAVRGRLMQAQPTTGTMAVVHADAETVRTALAGYPGVEIAAYNAPRSLTISGPEAAIDAFCTRTGHHTQKLTVSHAFHSAAMEGALAPFAEAVATTSLSAPRIPFVSTYTGDRHTATTVTDPHVWARAIREPVRFSQALTTVGDAGARVFWEIGPHPVLTGLGRATLPDAGLQWLHTLRRGRSDQEELHTALTSHYNHGNSEIHWDAVHHGKNQRTTTIPTYPFNRQRFWISAPARHAYPLPEESTANT
ncbi:beta-ketoacyl synthase N-terminal-like domain-containing protein [Streptomyces sp. NPDC059568]|uniref:beta-ketoacyl synthase N-terminal-like domain-containing protein n=1 Tax=Streptomyces sp. NPDC059568 TaxID=3346868 RepID=UPI0036A39E32